MKIIVDTKEDSKEQIKKAAQFLISIADGVVAEQEFNAEAPEGAFGMFDRPKPEKKPFNMNQLQEY